MPLTSAAFVVGGLSLIGVPGTAGFISKWLLIEAVLIRILGSSCCNSSLISFRCYIYLENC